MTFRAERQLRGRYMLIWLKVDNKGMVPKTTARWSLERKSCSLEIQAARCQWIALGVCSVNGVGPHDS